MPSSLELTGFVLMPFREEFKRLYSEAIREALRENGIRALLAPDVQMSEDAMVDIHRGIWEARVIVADLTGLNHNVFYELGIACELNKPRILLSQSVADLPFDLRRDQVLTYRGTDDGTVRLKHELADRVRSLLERGWTSPPSWKQGLNADILGVPGLLWIEARVKSEVWIIEPEESFQDLAFHSVIVSNLERGVVYRFIVSDEPETEQSFRQALGQHYGKGAQVLYVPEESLEIPLSTAIFDPFRPEICGYQYLPNGQTIYGIPLAPSLLRRARRLFRSMWDGSPFRRHGESLLNGRGDSIGTDS